MVVELRHQNNTLAYGGFTVRIPWLKEVAATFRDPDRPILFGLDLHLAFENDHLNPMLVRVPVYDHAFRHPEE